MKMNGDDPTERSQWTEEPSGEVTLGKVNAGRGRAKNELENNNDQLASRSKGWAKSKMNGCVCCLGVLCVVNQCTFTVIFRCRQMNELRMPRGIPSIPRPFSFIVWGNTANDDGRTERTLCLL
ncbi:hypothetical protein niasHT_020490 [Heterodera trifolii]|uniref:Uncharacterized protein n=1 Tax=Heterodera trifolii TaxID=157864 RepID=A0ABD2J9I2_9BILA